MIHIPSGKFLMGSDPKQDPHAEDREQPQHTLSLPDYYLAQTPVTNTQYQIFVDVTGHRAPQHWQDGHPPHSKADHPVVHVSWHDALAYCRWLAEVTGKPYRLPSEAEWEKGARGNDGRLYPWGNQWNPQCCNSNESELDDTSPVGAYPHGASPYGLLDMAGNVWEWTTSLWGKEMKEPEFGYPYDPADGREDLEAGRAVMRVLRGSAFYYNIVYTRSAYRIRSYPDYRVRTRGFRVCTSAPATAET
jgi:formylglycine-generating enzyme required for sulfatase activity